MGGVLASSAAPTFFPIHQGYIDGALAANNPSMIALGAAMDPLLDIGADLANVRIFSLGTGQCKKMKRSAFSRDDPGLAQWLKSLIGISLAMNEQMAAIYANSILQDGVFRLNPELGENIDGFDASPQNLKAITDIAMSVDLQPAIA